ncbi:MAG: hypothetical protein EAY75_13235 [Bacteroidetes bacterium]|nr:MAG: hypothetical protein EAY75_13235 [Bacteroidota bacterium]
MPTFDNISLTPLLLADLYADCMVIAAVSTAKQAAPAALNTPTATANTNASLAAAPAAATPTQFLGGFGKQVAILVRQPGAVHIAENELEFLNKILAAVKLSLADVAIVNVERQEAKFPFFLNEQAPQCLIAFGVEASVLQVPMVVPQFQITTWHNCGWLFAPSIHHFLGTSPQVTALKTQLWQALQQLFQKKHQ